MSDLYKQAFLRGFSDNPNQKEDFALFESMGEFFERNVSDAKNFFARFQTVRDRVAYYKSKVMADLANHLIDFESRLSAQGGKVIYAEDAAHALAEIEKLVPTTDNLFLSQSELLHEIGLKAFLKGRRHTFFLSDLQSLPYPLLPEPSDKILSELIQAYTIEDYKPSKEDVMFLYKKHLINRLYSNSTVITSADFLISDMGAAVISDQGGLNTLYTSFCRKHIVVAGIDRLIPSLSEADYFTSMRAACSMGRNHAWNEMIVSGPRSGEEIDGPEEFYVILIDNGRTELLNQVHQRSVFNCIHCQACQVLCPVFKFTNRLDGLSVKGPLNCVKDPICKGFEDNAYLAFACTLCGKCSEVCPAKIDLQELILYNRKEAVEREMCFSIERKQMKLLKKMLLKQKSLDSGYNRFSIKMKFKKMYGTQKEFPDFGKKGFRLQWQESMRNNNKK